jgi:hypothetical protein
VRDIFVQLPPTLPENGTFDTAIFEEKSEKMVTCPTSPGFLLSQE